MNRDASKPIGQRGRRGKQEETFVSIGTEQPTDASDIRARDRNNFLPVWQQEARDEKGKKRLHGAFTGGFSAGYFNTVGSKEGWTPSTFVSKKDGIQKAMKPEDFMDEEDVEEFLGSNKVHLQEEYDVLGGTARELKRRKAASENEPAGIFGGVSSALADSIIVPVRDTIGVKLMRLMGWREGQGIGPRAKRKQKIEEADPHAENHLFAPVETKIEQYDAKRNFHGMGYDPTKEAPEFQAYGQGKEFLFKENEEKKKRSAVGFGVGIFEDEDDDIYYGGEENTYNTIMMEEDDEFPEKTDKYSDGRKSGKLPNKMEKIHQLKLGFDGKPPLKGFLFSVELSVVKPIWYGGPQIPKSWKPKAPFENNNAKITSGHRKLTIDQRRTILGEESLQGRSIKETLKKAPVVPLEFNFQALPTIDKASALLALNGFTPFGDDLSKQIRYKRFLQVKAEIERDFIPPPAHMAEQARFHELMEFSKAAQIYRPLSSSMASRFTSSNEAKKDTQLDSDKAAAMKMYGPLTRTEEKWAPSNLLCKRLNIRNPYPDKSDPYSEDLNEKQILNKRVMDQLMMDLNPSSTALDVNISKEADDLLEMNLVYGETENSVETEEVKQFVRPTMELFKSIFADTEDEESEAEDDQKLIESVKTIGSTYISENERNNNIVDDDTTYDIPMPKELQIPVKTAIEKEQKPLPPPTFRPLFTKKEDRVIKKKVHTNTSINTSSQNNQVMKNKAKSSLSFDISDEDDVNFTKAAMQNSKRPTAADYL